MGTKKNKGQARLRLVVNNEISGGYMSGRSSWRETPDAFSRSKTRSAGTRPDRLHFWSAWYRIPNFSDSGISPPPASIARSTGLMPDNLQLRVALSQQLRVSRHFNTMQPMVVESEAEREHFRKALNDRVAKEHPAVRGRARWLYLRLKTHLRESGRRKKISEQTCGNWMRGDKIAKLGNDTILCEALGMTRSELFGDSQDYRLSTVFERWETLPEHTKNIIFAAAAPDMAERAKAS